MKLTKCCSSLLCSFIFYFFLFKAEQNFSDTCHWWNQPMLAIIKAPIFITIVSIAFFWLLSRKTNSLPKIFSSRLILSESSSQTRNLVKFFWDLQKNFNAKRFLLCCFSILWFYKNFLTFKAVFTPKKLNINSKNSCVYVILHCETKLSLKYCKLK